MTTSRVRRILAVAVASALVLGAGTGEAVAGKKKKKRHLHDSFTATLLPFPNYSSSTGTAKPGCSAGQEGVNWAAAELEVPFSGELTFYIEGFDGDWDIYVFADGDAPIARSDQEQVGPTLAPPEEKIVVPVGKKDVYTLVACNWAGEPQIEAFYELAEK